MRVLAEAAGITPGEVLVTRRYGRLFLEALDAELRKIPAETVVFLDFQGVEIMDASFVDEVFSTLAARHEKRIGLRHYLLLQTLSPHLLENLDITLSSRPQREPGLRNCVLPYVDLEGRVELVGKAEGHVRETFDLLRTRRQLGTRDVADAFDLELHAASVRLKVLYDLYLATRREEPELHGKQFIYLWPF
jgi:hypothetical protein